jgi:hypothetical protein
MTLTDIERENGVCMGVRDKGTQMAAEQCLNVERDSRTETKIAKYQSNTEGYNDRCIMQMRGNKVVTSKRRITKRQRKERRRWEGTDDRMQSQHTILPGIWIFKGGRSNGR